MVGVKGSKFFKEGASVEYAPSVVDKAWTPAAQRGLSNIFVKQHAGFITDDHVIIKAKIPMIDIVHYDPAHGFFGDCHFTRRDNLELIDNEILGAVAQVIIQVVYRER